MNIYKLKVMNEFVDQGLLVLVQHQTDLSEFGSHYLSQFCFDIPNFPFFHLIELMNENNCNVASL